MPAPTSSPITAITDSSEYVYPPDGQTIGVIRQRRILQSLAGDRIRALQQCDPEPALEGHPIAAFAGEWVFELSTDGHLRYGTDVIGCGEVWGEGRGLGSGCWSRFGKVNTFSPVRRRLHV